MKVSNTTHNEGEGQNITFGAISNEIQRRLNTRGIRLTSNTISDVPRHSMKVGERVTAFTIQHSARVRGIILTSNTISDVPRLHNEGGGYISFSFLFVSSPGRQINPGYVSPVRSQQTR